MSQKKLILAIGLGMVLGLGFFAEVQAELVGSKFGPGLTTKLKLPQNNNKIIVYTPKNYTPDKTWPVIVCYHGYKAMAMTWPFQTITGGRDFIIIGMNYVTLNNEDKLPLNRTSLLREVKNFNYALDEVAKNLKIDRERICIGGFSMGGFASARLGEMMASKLRGIAILGAGRPAVNYYSPGSSLREKPIFIGLGANDHNRKNADAAASFYRRAGAKLTYEKWPNLGHTMEYRNTKLHQWLLMHIAGTTAEQALERAQSAQTQGNLGLAYLLYEFLAANCSGDSEVGQAASSQIKIIVDMADREFAIAIDLLNRKVYVEAYDKMKEQTQRYARTRFARRAAEAIQRMDEDPIAARAIANQRMNDRADQLEADARELMEKQEYAKALKLLNRYKVKYPRAKRAAEVKKLLAECKAAKKCSRWLATAEKSIKREKFGIAEKYLDKVSRFYPKTEWAKKADEMKKAMEALPEYKKYLETTEAKTSPENP